MCFVGFGIVVYFIGFGGGFVRMGNLCIGWWEGELGGVLLFVFGMGVKVIWVCNCFCKLWYILDLGLVLSKWLMLNKVEW